MKTDELPLLALAADMARVHPPVHAVILDLSGVLHIDEPVFHRTLSRWLRTDGSGDTPAGVRSFELSHNRLVLVVEDQALPRVRATLSSVANVLAEHRRGAMHALWFDLARDSEGFMAAVRDLVAAAHGGEVPGALATGDALARFLAIERSLHAVDLSALVRQQPAWSLADRADPKPVFVELTVALEELDRVFDVGISRDAWLYGRVTELLDRRMLFHLVHDRSPQPLPLAVKLHADTVLGEDFTARIAALPAGRHGRLIVELPWLEWESMRERVVAAVAVLRRHEIGVAIDHVPLTALASGDLPEADWYRISWLDAAGHAVDLSGLTSAGFADRVVLARCTGRSAVEAGLKAGIRVFQGRAVTEMARSRTLPAPTEAAPRATGGGGGPAEPDPVPAGSTPAVDGAGGPFAWITRILRPRAPAAAVTSAGDNKG